MSSNDQPTKKPLENEGNRKQVASPNQKEVILLDLSDDDSDIEIIQENVNKLSLCKTIQEKLNKNNCSRNRINDKRKQHFESSKAKRVRATHVNEQTSNSDYTNVCGFMVNIKSLLQNDIIRKQLEPFIEKEVIIIKCHETPDVLSLPNEIHEKKITILNEKISYTLKENEQIINVDSEPQDTLEHNIADEIVLLEYPNSDIVEEIGINSKNTILFDTVEVDSGKINNYTVIDKTTKIEDLNSILGQKLDITCETVTKTYNCGTKKNTSVENLSMINSDPGKNKEHNNCKLSEYQDAKVMESDDWYYLNVTNIPPVTNDENNSLFNKTSSNLNANAIDKNNETSVIKKTYINKRKIFGKRRKIINKNKNGIINNRRKLLGRIVKGGLKNSINNVKNTLKNNDLDTINNVSQDISTMTLIKEETVIPDVPVTDSLEISNIVETSNEKEIVESYDIFMPNTESLPDGTIINDTENGSKCKIDIPIIIKREKTVDDGNIEIDWDKYNALINFDETSSDKVINSSKMDKKQQKKRTTLESMSNVKRKTNHNENRQKQNLFKRKLHIYKCKLCGKQYSQSGYLKRHEIKCRSFKLTQYDCALCSFTTTNRLSFRDHLGNHILGSNYSRSMRYDASSVPNYKTNKRIKSSENYLMAACTSCLKNRKAVETVDKCYDCLAPLEFWCGMCNLNFETYMNLCRHVNFNLGTRFKTMKCFMCNKRCLSRCMLKSHEERCKTLFKKQLCIRLVRCDDQIQSH